MKLSRTLTALGSLALLSACSSSAPAASAASPEASTSSGGEIASNGPPPEAQASAQAGARVSGRRGSPTDGDVLGRDVTDHEYFGGSMGSMGGALHMGTDAEHPIGVCGPMESYRFIASTFRCPDGSNPLAGDWRAGQSARVGNVGANSQGHIIDLYRVPCASGPVDVFVDMYQCAGGGSP